MEKDTPVLRMFEKNGKYYCYDPFPNKIYLLSKNHYTEITKLIAMGKSKYITSITDAAWGSPARDILYMLNMGNYFKEELLQECVYPDIELVPDLYDRAIHDLALQITQKCNFSCRYCRYATDNGISRKHTNTNMSEEIAQKAIDYLMTHSTDANQVNIAFCGGEPLLNFTLIKEILQYIRSKYPYKPVTYNLTSNASLLKEEYIDIFQKNNFQLMISLDGPENVQNYNRKFLSNGEGTYAVVMDNIKRLMKNHKKYFQNNVTFNAVYLNESQRKDAEAFFRDLNVIDKVRLVDADLKGIDYVMDMMNVSDSLYDENGNHKDDQRDADWYINREQQMKKGGNIPSRWHHGGPCIPGIRRLYVDTFGNLFPCEKLMEAPGLSIGSLESGIHMESVLKLLNIGDLTSEDCKHCFAFRFCSICCSHCIDPTNNCLSSTCKTVECNNQKTLADAFLRAYVD